MKKALQITIAGSLFTIEEDAYQNLDQYLHSIKNYFGSYPDSKEIINDIEARIAEQLLDRSNKDAVVTIEDVDKLISVMGRVEDIADESTNQNSSTSNASEARTEYRAPRRLYRDTDDVWIMGVASGLGAYFGIDPLIVRIVFIILTLITAFVPMLVIYFILALLIPPAKTPAEKFQMRGGPVDLKSFKENINDYAQNVKNSSKNFGEHIKTSSNEFAANIKRSAQHFKESWKEKESKDDFLTNSSSEYSTPRAQGGIVGWVRSMVRLVFKLIGFAIKLAATLAIIAVVFVFIGMIFRFHPFGMVPVAQVVSWPIYYLVLTLGFLAAILPLSLLSMIGNFFMLKRRPFSLHGALGIIGTWFAVILIGGAIVLSYGPTVYGRIRQLPAYQQSTKDFQLTNFSNIEVNGAEMVHITQGPSYAVHVRGHQGDIDDVSLSVNNNTLQVSRSGRDFCFFCLPADQTIVDVTMPTISKLEAHGASGFTGTIIATSSPFALTLDGASRANLALTTSQLTLTETGASRAELTGSTTDMKITLSGASRFMGDSFVASTTSIEATGASHATVHVLEMLNAQAHGASKIYYSGSPKITQETSGASKVQAQ